MLKLESTIEATTGAQGPTRRGRKSTELPVGEMGQARMKHGQGTRKPTEGRGWRQGPCVELFREDLGNGRNFTWAVKAWKDFHQYSREMSVTQEGKKEPVPGGTSCVLTSHVGSSSSAQCPSRVSARQPPLNVLHFPY